jgi:hypothetical protein
VFQVHNRGVGYGIVRPDDFQEAAIPRPLLFYDNDPVTGLFLGSVPGKAYHQHRLVLLLYFGD